MTFSTAVQAEVVVSGVGETEYTRGTAQSLQALCLEASRAAIHDAGLDRRSIDGLVLPISGLGLHLQDVMVPLGIEDLKFHATLSLGGAGPAAAVALAARAISSGIASAVLVPCPIRGYSDIRLRDAGSDAKKFDWPGAAVRDYQDFPAGLIVPMQWYALQAHRWIYETGADVGGFETVSLATRAHANRNPNAYFATRPLTSDAYRSSPEIVSPFRLFDICIESDGAAAVVVQKAEHALSQNDHAAVLVAGGGEARPVASDNIPGRKPIWSLGLSRLAPRVFADLGLSHSSVDFAEIYDCFTYVVLRQLEDLGFCELGESPEFVAEMGIGPAGRLPVNTHGGLLSAAHIAGMNHVVEAVKQLRGSAGPTQVPEARIGLVTGYGDFGDGSMIVLRR
jgi:acetyl-CoA acetyltransferase